MSLQQDAPCFREALNKRNIKINVMTNIEKFFPHQHLSKIFTFNQVMDITTDKSSLSRTLFTIAQLIRSVKLKTIHIIYCIVAAIVI